MKPIRIITLALVLALCAFSAPPAHAQTPVCKIYGTVGSVAGPTSTLTTTRAQITVTRASKSGSLFLNTSRVFNADATGRIEFYAPRTVGTDTAVIHIRANFGDLSAGQTVYVPDADSAELRTLPRYTANPTLVVVAVPSGGGSADTSLNGHPRLTRIENVEGQFTAGTSDSLQQIAANVFVARNVAEGKADADSVKLAFDRLGDRADADSLAGVKTTADGAFQRADTNAVHAQKFAVINDSLFAISLRATSTKNDLTAHIGTADAHLPSQTGQAGKLLGTNGTVTSWQSEADPTVALRIRDSLALYNLPWMRGDTAAIGRILDGMYPRSGGCGSVDSSRLMPGFAGQTKSYPGSITMANGGVSAPTGTVSAKTVVADSVRLSRVFVDTLGFIDSDSARWIVQKFCAPFGMTASFKANNYPASRGGTITFIVTPKGIGNWTPGYNGYCSVKLVADSANGVEIGPLRYKVYNDNLGSVGPGYYEAMLRNNNLSLPANDMLNAVQVVDLGGIGRLAGKVLSFPNQRNQINLRMFTSASADPSILRYEIEVSYQVRTGATSSWYLKLQ